MGFVLSVRGLCNALLCQDLLVLDLDPYVVLLDVLAKPPFSMAGEGLLGKVRVFWRCVG